MPFSLIAQIREAVEPTALAAPASIQSPPRAQENAMPSTPLIDNATFVMPDPNDMPMPEKFSFAVSA